MSRCKSLFWCLLVIVSAGCYSYGPRFDPRNPTAKEGGQELPYFSSLESSNLVDQNSLTAPTNFYRVGPGDVLDIEILGEPASRSAITVGPDGKIYYSLLPGTFVWGLTLAETKQTIEEGLAKFIRVQPEIAITLTAAVSKKVWLLGHVKRPGLYPLATPMTLLEAISAAGGTVIVPGSAEEMADLENSFIMRDGKLLNVSLYKLLRQGDLGQNIYLQPDDFLYLRSSGAKEITVLGAVLRPTVIDYAQQATVLSAIATAGGTAPYAYVSHVVIVRDGLTQPKAAVVDYNKIRHGEIADISLQAGDLVYIPFRPFQKLEKFVEGILDEFVRTVAINEGISAGGGTGSVGISVSPR